MVVGVAGGEVFTGIPDSGEFCTLRWTWRANGE
jgi:hypothetical protein